MPTPRWSFLSSAEYNPQTAVHNATRVALIHPGSFLPSSAFLCRSLPILDPPLPSVDLPLPFSAFRCLTSCVHCAGLEDFMGGIDDFLDAEQSTFISGIKNSPDRPPVAVALRR